MNPDSPQNPREDLDARLTALLLGELPDQEAHALRRIIAQDAASARLYERLKRTVDLVGEATASATEPAAAQSAPLRLSEERRQKLLAHFKTVAPKEFIEPRRRDWSWLVPLGAAAAAVLLLAAIALPNFTRARTTAQSNAIINNLRQIDGAKQQWALETHKSANDVPTLSDIAPYMGRGGDGLPPSVAGETYILGKVGESPTAELKRGGRVQQITLSDETELAWANKEKPVAVVTLGEPTRKFAAGKPLEVAPAMTRPPVEPGLASSQNTANRTEIVLPAGSDESAAQNTNWIGGGFGGGGIGGGGGFGGATSGGIFDLTRPHIAGWTLGRSKGEASTPTITTSSADGDAWKQLLTNRMDDLAHSNRFVARYAYDINAELPDQQKFAKSVSGLPPGASIPAAPETTIPPEMPKLSATVSKDGHEALDRKSGKVPVLGDVPGVGTLFRSNGVTADSEINQTLALARQAPRQTVGWDSSSWGVVQSGVVSEVIGSTNFLSLANAARPTPPSSVAVPPAVTREPFSLKPPAFAGKDVTKTPDASELERRDEQVKEAQAKVDDLRVKLGVADMMAESGAKDARQEVAKYQPYFEARRELESAQKARDSVQLRILQESTDLAIPKSSVVEIADLAEAQSAKSPTLGQRLTKAATGKVERTARISVEKDVPDVTPLGFPQNNTAYDPFFIQTEFEKIKSRPVLNKVIEKLDLNDAWAKKYGNGDKLTTEKTFELLSKNVDVRQEANTSLIDIGVKNDDPAEAARIANAIAEVYRDERAKERQEVTLAGIARLKENLDKQNKKVASAKEALERVKTESGINQADQDLPVRRPAPNAPIPQPEVLTRDNAFSTFSLNVSDVSFKLAAASLEKGQMPDAATVRSEEFINAFDYRDPEPPPGAPIAFNWERARYPFAQNRDLLRFSIKTAAAGRQPGCSLNLVLLLDNSGSMERADRVRIIHEALRVLAGELQPQDRISVVTFARTARLVADGIAGDKAGAVFDEVSGITPQGGTNLEEAMRLAYETALRHYLANGVNRVVLLTDGAANLGNVDPEALKRTVETNRKQGIALDCFGVGWEGYNDDLLEVLSSNGDGRYGFLNSPEEAATQFAGQLAGALKVAASDVKVQVEFNPKRVTAYRQIGYAKHQLTKEQFRDNTVDAAEIGAAEAGNALYTIEMNPQGDGPLATVRVRYRLPGTSDYREQAWDVPFTGSASALDQSSAAMRLATTASAFSEWLVASPYAVEVTPDALLGYLNGVPDVYGADERPKKLEWMIRQTKSIAGK